MFTGIVECQGRVAALEPKGGDVRLRIDAGDLSLADSALGDSICVSGVCLTAVTIEGGEFAADVSNETLKLTTLGDLKPGSSVNLEKSLTLSQPLGGHLVSGHVDGMGEVVSLSEDARSWRFVFHAPAELARYIARKGSIAIDGVSLTVNGVEDTADGCRFDVNIVPHTMERTVIGTYAAGTRVNLEVDVVARYLERLVAAGETPKAGLSLETLKEYGFAKGH